MQVPVVVCGNKIDLRGGEITNQELEREIAPLMNEFKVCLLGLFLPDACAKPTSLSLPRPSELPISIGVWFVFL